MSIDRRRAGQRGHLRRNAGADGSTVDTVTFLNGGIGIDTISGPPRPGRRLRQLGSARPAGHRLRDRDEERRTDHLSFTEAASNLSGTLTVTDDVHIANIELLINYTAGQFVAGLRRTRRTLITFEASSSTPTGGNGNGHG